jgi:DnaJ-class molecular chaperone
MLVFGAVQAANTADAFLKCKLAYEVLSDAEQRMRYDQAVAAAAGLPAGQVRASELELRTPQAGIRSPADNYQS